MTAATEAPAAPVTPATPATPAPAETATKAATPAPEATLATKLAEASKGEKPAEPAKAEADKPFDWQWKDGEKPADAYLSALEKAARANGANVEQAKGLFVALREQLHADQKAQADANAKAIQTDPDVGGDNLKSSLAAVGKLIRAHGTPEMQQLLSADGLDAKSLGSIGLPFLKFLVKVAGEFSEDSIATGTAAARKKTLGEKLFPDLAAKKGA